MRSQFLTQEKLLLNLRIRSEILHYFDYPRHSNILYIVQFGLESGFKNPQNGRFFSQKMPTEFRPAFEGIPREPQFQKNCVLEGACCEYFSCKTKF